MSDIKRVEEAEKNTTTYLNDGLLKKEQFNQVVYNTYLKNHYESLELAAHVYGQKLSPLWTVVLSYYSMFYLANAVLYSMGYKVGHKIAHKITADALIALVHTKLTKQLMDDYEHAQDEAAALSDTLMKDFDYEREKRSYFQYETTEEIKYTKAKTSLERAKRFSLELAKLLK